MLPLASLLFGLWLGPLAIFFVSPWIDIKKTMAHGCKRAFYAEATRSVSRRIFRFGMILWIMVAVFPTIMSQFV